PRPFILSAERTGATMFQKELDVNKNEIVEQISRVSVKDIEETVFNVLNTRYSRYPKPVKDNIYFVRELDEVAKQTSFIKKGEKENALHKEIIELLYQVVGGKYIVSPEGIEFAPGAKQRITKGKFLVQRASSSVRSLLMLNYYVLYRAQVGDILMIDEPELNLHPKNQILVARLLVLLVNAGIKVFITTHSDYIVRELSNCIMLKNLSNEQIKKLAKQGYSKEYGLESKKVKAYLAENIKGKNTLRAAKITQEQGIFMETFDEPIDLQNENQGLIFEEAMRSKGDSNDK
ncbi:AAA family ATPase, partial [Helicobacter typhlonius]|uniref:AAA family ATPase n=2 Tax=Helicobacter TaxID=209 RepID=UPI002FE352CD